MNHEVTATQVLMHPMTPHGAIDVIHTLIRQRDQARDLVALLEAECAQCWGPMHTSAIDRLPEGEI